MHFACLGYKDRRREREKNRTRSRECESLTFKICDPHPIAELVLESEKGTLFGLRMLAENDWNDVVPGATMGTCQILCDRSHSFDKKNIGRKVPTRQTCFSTQERKLR